MRFKDKPDCNSDPYIFRRILLLKLTKHFSPFSRERIVLAILIAGGFLLFGRGALVFADTPLVNGTVNAGSLSESAPGPYAFTGTPGTTATFTMPFSASDTTGGAAGWNITITSTQFKDGGGTGTHTIPTTASNITGTTGVCTAGGAAGVNCMQAPLTNTVVTSVALPSGVGPPTAVKFFGIAAASASGVYTITPTITVVIPAITFLATYTSTFTLAIVSGP